MPAKPAHADRLQDPAARAARGTMAQDVCARLRADIVRLALAPGDRLSEAEIARRFGVSRQPVREAFIQLAAQGLLAIRPQRPTEVVKISSGGVLNAIFVRAALEEAVVKRVAAAPTEGVVAILDELIAAQEVAAAAEDRDRFHTLDEAFHQALCRAAGVDFVWPLIDAQKAQVDRARYLTIEFNKGRVIRQHREVRDRIVAGDVAGAGRAMVAHVSEIERHLPRIRAENPEVFDPEEPGGDAEPDEA